MDKPIQRQGSNQIYIPLQEQSFSNSQPNIVNLQQQMAPPIIQPQIQQQPIIINQMVKPNVIHIDTTNFKTSPCYIVCPFCRGQVMTHVQKKCNWYSCLLCYCFGLWTWICLQCCRNKELNCYNATHFCPRCGNKIVEYNSC